jgi:hypothetical protein
LEGLGWSEIFGYQNSSSLGIVEVRLVLFIGEKTDASGLAFLNFIQSIHLLGRISLYLSS